MQTEGKMQTADCRPGVKCRLSVKQNTNNRKKNTRIKSGSKKDLIWQCSYAYPYPYFFSKTPKTQTKRRFLALVEHYIINLEFVTSPFCWTKFPTRTRSNRNSMDLTFVYLSAIFSFVSAVRSGTEQLLQQISFILFHLSFHWQSLNPSRVLVALDGLGIVWNRRQSKYDSTTAGQAKLIGTEPEVAGLAHNDFRPWSVWPRPI